MTFQPAEFPHIASAADHPIHDELRAVHEARCLLDAVRDLSDDTRIRRDGSRSCRACERIRREASYVK